MSEVMRDIARISVGVFFVVFGIGFISFTTGSSFGREPRFDTIFTVVGLAMVGMGAFQIINGVRSLLQTLKSDQLTAKSWDDDAVTPPREFSVRDLYQIVIGAGFIYGGYTIGDPFGGSSFSSEIDIGTVTMILGWVLIGAGVIIIINGVRPLVRNLFRQELPQVKPIEDEEPKD